MGNDGTIVNVPFPQIYIPRYADTRYSFIQLRFSGILRSGTPSAFPLRGCMRLATGLGTGLLCADSRTACTLYACMTTTIRGGFASEGIVCHFCQSSIVTQSVNVRTHNNIRSAYSPDKAQSGASRPRTPTACGKNISYSSSPAEYVPRLAVSDMKTRHATPMDHASDRC